MSNVEFESDQFYSNNSYVEMPSKMVGLVMKLGAKDETQANKILLIILGVLLVLTFFVIIFSGSSNDKDVIDPATLINSQQI